MTVMVFVLVLRWCATDRCYNSATFTRKARQWWVAPLHVKGTTLYTYFGPLNPPIPCQMSLLLSHSLTFLLRPFLSLSLFLFLYFSFRLSLPLFLFPSFSFSISLSLSLSCSCFRSLSLSLPLALSRSLSLLLSLVYVSLVKRVYQYRFSRKCTLH